MTAAARPFRVHPAVAVGTDLLYAAVTSTGGSLVHGFNKTIDWKVVGRLALGSVPTTALSIAAVMLFARKPLLKWFDAHIGEPDPRLVGRPTVVPARCSVFPSHLVGRRGGHRRHGAGDALSQDADAAHRRLRPRARRAADLPGRPRPFPARTVDLTILGSLLCAALTVTVVASIASARMSDTVVRVVLGLVLLAVAVRFWLI